MTVLSIVFWSLFATILACVEIESEGKCGWAEKMPTWYRTTGLPARIYGAVMGGKPLTGYHAFVFFLPVFIFHAHFTLGIPWSLAAECKAWAMYFAWCVLWDYHWFVLNPHYAGKFNRKHVWWHAKSFWIAGLFPVDYAIGVILSIVLAFAGQQLGEPSLAVDHLKILMGFGAYTALLHAAAPAYHRWYTRMREKDDRNKTDIFHH